MGGPRRCSVSARHATIKDRAQGFVDRYSNNYRPYFISTKHTGSTSAIRPTKGGAYSTTDAITYLRVLNKLLPRP